MEIKFSVYETPKPKGRENEKTVHARLQPRGTKHLEDICEHISDVASLTSSDVKGALEAFFQYMSFQLRYGYNVELDGIGLFSVALKSKECKDKETNRKHLMVKIDGVNFRCSTRLKKALNQSTLKKEEKTKMPFPRLTDRQERMENFLRRNDSISIRQYAMLNQCSRYYATKDLSLFVENGLLRKNGMGTHKVYLFSES